MGRRSKDDEAHIASLEEDNRKLTETLLSQDEYIVSLEKRLKEHLSTLRAVRSELTALRELDVHKASEIISKAYSGSLSTTRLEALQALVTELQQLRANLKTSKAAMAGVQSENKRLRAALPLQEFLPPCEIQSWERGVHETMGEDGRILKEPTREFRLSLRHPFDNEVINPDLFELKMIPVWVLK